MKSRNETIPPRFLCPLTQQIMNDPVILTSVSVVEGRKEEHKKRFERIAIIHHLHNKDPKTCPVTGFPIADELSDLPSDRELKAEIMLFRKINKHLEESEPLIYIARNE